MERVLETERLALDRFVAARDAAFLLELLNDPDFIANIRDTGARSLGDAAAYAVTGPIASYARHGFGLWRVTLRACGTPVGMCGPLRRDTLPAPDLGFAFLAAHRRRGLAREAATAVMAHARTRLGIGRLLAIAAPHNAASIALLAGLGFVAEGETVDGARLFVADGGQAANPSTGLR